MREFRWERPAAGGRWGDRSTGRDAAAGVLSAAAAALLDSVVGPPGYVPAAGATEGLSLVDVPASRLSAADVSMLTGLLGESYVSVDDALRAAHSHGLSYSDVVAARAGGVVGRYVDAVVAPSSADLVLALLEWCSARRIAVVPFGGGTSVVGGVSVPVADAASFSAVIAVSLAALDALLAFDAESALVTVEAGMTGPVLERLLAARGFTLGHFPQSFARATIGGYIAARSAGQASTGYGRMDEMVEAVSLATPVGAFAAGRGPSSAAGPSLLRLVQGSEGAFGIVTSASLRVRPLPTVRRYVGYMAPSFDAGVAAFRGMVRAGCTADVMRLADSDETATTMAMSGPTGVAGAAFSRYLSARGVTSSAGCLMILGWEGTDAGFVSARARAARSVLSSSGVVSLGSRVGSSWEKHRFDGPFLRDTLIDSGYLVETLESAASWSALSSLASLVRSSLAESLAAYAPYVMAHISHVYDTGASLYFTVLAQQPAEVSVWTAAKAEVTSVLVSAGFTVSHHHGVGRDHRAGLEQEDGELGIAVLRSVKSVLDPAGIMNPGVLIAGGVDS